MAVSTTDSGLTERQEQFCIEYVLNKGNGASAARRAGYSESGDDVEAYRLLRNAKIIARIAELREQSGVKTGANIEWLESMLVSAIERCAQATQVYDREGNPTGIYAFDSKGIAANANVLMRLKSWEGVANSKPIEEIANQVAEQWKAMKESTRPKS